LACAVGHSGFIVIEPTDKTLDLTCFLLAHQAKPLSIDASGERSSFLRQLTSPSID